MPLIKGLGLWSKVVECHQDNRLSIGDAYRLKHFLMRQCSITLRRDGDHVVLEFGVEDVKIPVIRKLLDTDFYEMITLAGVEEICF